jgi:homocysteine S-methyltransferase
VTTLAEAIEHRVVLLDGGLATELERRGHDLSSQLWSGRLLMDDPDAIVDVHRAYFAAGADIATSASYQVSFAEFGLSAVDAATMLRRSVDLARRARDEHGAGWVAASVGPYGAVLADGSEYRGDYGLSVAQLREFHRPRLDVLATAGADVLAVETIPCLAEVEAVLAELAEIGMPAWLSMTSAGGRTRTGEPLADAFAMARDSAPVFAAGVNCLAPDDVTEALRIATRHSGKPAVAYPNSGQRWDAGARCWTGPPAFAASAATAWSAAGARLLGGCCRVGPSEISALGRALGPQLSD